LAIFSKMPAALSVAQHCSKKAIILSGLAGTILFKSTNLFWCALGCAKKVLFTLLLRGGYVHCSTEVVAFKVAEKLYSTMHELVHRHESGLLGRTKPANQLVANVGEPGNGLKVVPDTFAEFFLHTICIFWTLLCNDTSPFSQF
jgi:hypothetical protein